MEISPERDTGQSSARCRTGFCNRRLRFLASRPVYVSDSVLLDIDEAMLARGIPSISNRQGKITKFLTKCLSKARLPVNLRRSSHGPIFVACMGFSEYKTIPFAYCAEIIPYCFDCWQRDWARWESFFRRQRTRLAFFTTRQSADHFRHVLPAMTAVWLPEAVNPSKYQCEKLIVERNIDVLEFGRKYDKFHDAVTEGLMAAGKYHRFERQKGEIIFDTRAAFISALGDAKMSVCFPRSLTDPQGAWHETVTQRYFESIASKCIVVGHCPGELADIFGYNPIIEIDDGRELDQILSILSQSDRFQPLVERNYVRLWETGTWAARLQTILEYTNQIDRD
jgi:hypothetical protein